MKTIIKAFATVLIIMLVCMLFKACLDVPAYMDGFNDFFGRIS